MPRAGPLSRRTFVQLGCAAAGAATLDRRALAQAFQSPPLEEVGYGEVVLKDGPQLEQRQQTTAILLGLDEDSLLKPFRAMAGQPDPGESLGGWYEYKADYDYKTDKAGLAPSATFGQWVSALARNYSATRDLSAHQKVARLTAQYAKTISPLYYQRNRFPAYCFDKLVCGLMDAHRLAADASAFPVLDATTDAAVQILPGHAVDRGLRWRERPDISWDWDESYTLPENLYLAYSLGAGRRYLAMAEQYLDDKTYFDPLSRGENVLGGKHAYSYVNALCSAMQAYLVAGSAKHLEAAINGFAMLEQQSFATGGWGPDELLRKPDSDDLFASLGRSHNSFETPCGSYAHMKLTRYLLRATRDGRYGDSMERVMYNTVLGAKPLRANGTAFYYSDYNFAGKRVYSDHLWPCCSGTLPQVAADYGINSYLREPGAVWINLYIPSVLRWREGSSSFAIEQFGTYPFTDVVELRVTAARPLAFTLRLRIPAWAEAASISVNGRAVPLEVQAGFAAVQRNWQNGDVIELAFSHKARLEPISPTHPEVAALVDGPLVLFAATADQPAITRNQALALRRVAPREWAIDTEKGPLRMMPFVDLGDTPYTTYLRLI